MKCSRCAHENPADTSFCGQCGARLAASCAACGASNPATNKFCGKCGAPVTLAEPAHGFVAPESYTPKHLAEKILTSRSALEGERKQVTVLFCDIVGSTSLADRLGPEPMHALLNRFFELALGEIHRYEGTINQFLGDGFMALFGAPVAHEDHATRAVLAAVAIQRRVAHAKLSDEEGVELAVRIGLNTGPVVVGKIGDNLRMDYTAVGDTTNLAARLQQLAESGVILVSEATQRQVGEQVRLEPLALLSVKGKTERVQAHRVLGLASRRSPLAARSERPLTRFVGREREVGMLDDLLEQAERGQGQVVGIVGEPGVGKSRLLYEFRQGLGDRRITYLEGRCPSYGASIPYLPVLDIVRSNCGIVDADSPAAVADKLRSAVEEVNLDPDRAVPYLLNLIGVKDESGTLERLAPDIIKARTLETLRQLAVKGSQRRPIIFAVEDAHWIDRPSEQYFDSLVENLPGAKILFVSTHRPGYRPPWLDRSYATQVALRPLSQPESQSIVQAVVPEDRLAGTIARLILEKAEGNPFFLEELARTVIEHPEMATALTVPETVQGVLMSRIDRLPDEGKQLLQVASVVGREVPRDLLEAFWEKPLEPHIGELIRREFLYHQIRSGSSVYVFKHALTQEVAYESLLSERRRTLHARVVDVIEQLYAGRLVEHVEQLARHAVRGELWGKAVDHLRAAGAKAHARGALQESLEQFEQALEVASRLPESAENARRAIDVRLDLHGPLYLMGQVPRLIELQRGAEEIARRIDDQRRLGAIAFRMGTYSFASAQYARGMAFCEEGLQIAAATGDSQLRIQMTYLHGVLHEGLGNHRVAAELLAGILEGPDSDLAKRSFGTSVGSLYPAACGWLVHCLSELGVYEQALHYYGDAGVREADAAEQPFMQAFTRTQVALGLILKGEFARAVPLSEQAVGVCESGNVFIWLPAAYAALGWSLAWAGRADEGVQHLERSVTIMEGLGTKFYLPRVYFWWAEGLLLADRVREAREAGEKALALATELGERGNEAHALRLLGDITAAGTLPNFAESFYERSRGLATELGLRPLVAHCHLGLGTLYRRTGKAEQAREHLTTSTTMYRDMDMRFWLEKAEKELGELA